METLHIMVEVTLPAQNRSAEEALVQGISGTLFQHEVIGVR